VDFSSESEADLDPLVAGVVESVYRSIEDRATDDLISPVETFHGIPLGDYEAAHLYQADGHLWSERFEFDFAIAAFEQSLALGALSQRDTRNLDYNLGRLYRFVGRSDEAIEATLRWFDSAEEPSSDGFYEVVEALWAADRSHEALAWIELAETYEGPDFEASMRKAYLQVELGRFAELERDRRARASDAERVQDLVFLISIWGESVDEGTRLRLMEFADSTDLLDGDGKSDLANLYLSMGMPYRAAVLMERALYDRAIEPDAERWELLAESWLAVPDPVRAAEPLERAADLSGEPELHDRLGRLLLELRRWRAAEDALRKAVAGGLSEARLRLFAALFAQGRFDEAREALAPPKPPAAPAPDASTEAPAVPPERAIPCLGVSLVEADQPVEAAVAEVQEQSPAAGAGFRAGDVIVQFGSRQIQSGEDFIAEIRATRPGEGFSAIVRRDAAHVSLRGVVGARAEVERSCAAAVP
jgi:tetratricopeptide (TPR) repeat protein